MRTLLVAFLVVGCGAAAAGGAARTAPEPPSAATVSAEGRLALGDGFGCALLASGPHCWGAPPFNGADPASAEVLGDAVELDASGMRLCARYRNGGVRCWDQVPETADRGTLTAPAIPAARRVWASDPPCALTENDEVWCWDTARVHGSFPSPRDTAAENDDADDDEYEDEYDGDAETEEEAPTFGRIATVPGAIDLMFSSSGSFYALDATGRLAMWNRDEVEESVVIEGARGISHGSNAYEVLVRIDGDRSVRARFGRGDEVELAPGPTAIGFADPYPLACVLEAADRAACGRDRGEDDEGGAESEGADPSRVELPGLHGMQAIAANDEQACVLTSDDEVHCVDIRSPPRIIELASASTGLSEQGHTVCAEGAPWTCMLGRGTPAAWPTREANCTGASWLPELGAPGPSNAGWTLCGTELRATVLDEESGGFRVVPVAGVSRVFGIEAGLALSMRNGTTRLLPTDYGWGEYATLGAPLRGFGRLRDFDQEMTHRCGVTARGTLHCESTLMDDHAFDVAGISNAAEVETAAGCACARTTEGTVQCVDFEHDDASNPVRDTGLSDITDLVGNNDQLCARSSAGHLWCSSDEFLRIPAAEQPTGSARCGAFLPTILDDVAEIEAGVSFLCARQSTGRVLCWGEMEEEASDARDIEARLAPDRTPIRVAP